MLCSSILSFERSYIYNEASHIEMDYNRPTSRLKPMDAAQPAAGSGQSTSDFSIDHILNRAGTRASIDCFEALSSMYHLRPPMHYDQQFAAPKEALDYIQTIKQRIEANALPSYDWLQYSRYKPPRLQNSSAKHQPAKRTPGRLPRVPFSTDQLIALENAYKESSYLAAEDSIHLAAKLNLTSIRVKIWFQNRRARERKERRDAGEASKSTTCTSPSERSRSTSISPQLIPETEAWSGSAHQQTRQRMFERR